MPSGSEWRSSPSPRDGVPPQGWKLHVSASILSATAVLNAVAPLLEARGVLFKAPASLLMLKKLNCGLFYGYVQVGKFLTAYPSSDDEACVLAHQLDLATRSFAGPAVPLEQPVASGSSVFTRYGSFGSAQDGDDGSRVRAPDGSLVEDQRTRNPEWAQCPPGLILHDVTPVPPGNPLATKFRAYQALVQRGKGGVYRALDLTTRPARLCLLKEGRSGGEVEWDGSDGRGWAERELEVLLELKPTPVPTPDVYHHFELEGNLYLVLEWIEGDSLADMLQPQSETLTIATALDIGGQCAAVLAQIHERRWVWRDLKAANLIVSEGKVRPLDFEGAARAGTPVLTPWGTAGYAPPEWMDVREASFAQDRYALGVLLHQLFTNVAPTAEALAPVQAIRPEVPSAVSQLIEALTHESPGRRGTAAKAFRALQSAQGQAKSAA